MPRIVIVIPCYNEAARLDTEEVLALCAGEEVSVLLVDDGSTDETAALLTELAKAHPDAVRTLMLPRNVGKAETVRQGLMAASPGADILGYCDADFATPSSEMLRLCRRLEEAQVDVVMGARVARLGAKIDRDPARHYLGRVFATAASLALGQTVYDTQCGAKLFRNGPALTHAIEREFHSRWAFDVELLGRLIGRGATVLEVPLQVWHDVGGSKLRSRDMIKASLDLVAIARSLRKSSK